MEGAEGAVAGENYQDSLDRARFNIRPCYIDTVAGSVERTTVTKMAAVEEVDVADVEEEEGMVVIMEAMVVMAEVAEEVADGEAHQVVNNYKMTEPGQSCIIITTLQYSGSGRGGGSDDWWGN